MLNPTNRRVAVLFAALFLCSATSHAQQTPTLGIVIESLDPDAAKCGVTESTLRTPAILALRNNRIRDSATPTTGVWLYLALNIMHIPNIDSCFFSFRASVESSGTPIVRNGFTSSQPETIELCASSGLGRAGRADAANYLSTQVDNSVKTCLSKLRY